MLILILILWWQKLTGFFSSSCLSPCIFKYTAYCKEQSYIMLWHTLPVNFVWTEKDFFSAGFQCFGYICYVVDLQNIEISVYISVA